MKILAIITLFIIVTCGSAFATPTLNLGQAVVSGTTISFPVTLTNIQGTSILGIEADIIFNSDVFAVKMNGNNPASAVAGTAATTAGKQIIQSSRDGVLHIAIIGGNTTPIPDGIVAQVSFDTIAVAPVKEESFAIAPTATDSYGPVTITGTGTSAPATWQLAIILNGNGDGSISSIPSGITCTGNGCSANIYIGTTVTITQQSATSSFGSWSGDCTGVGNCTIVMTANRSATASFILSNTVQVGANRYGTLTGAYTVAPTKSIIQSMEVTFFEHLDLNRDIPVTLRGGCNSTFLNCTGYTTINGTLTISKGSLVAERLRLQ